MKIIEDSRKGGAEELALSSTGEPLINRNLEKYASYAKSIGYTYVFFNTNGLLLDRKRSECIISSGVDSVKISINAGKRNYLDIHGVDAYEKVLQNMKDFDDVRKSVDSTCKLYVSYISTRATEAEIYEVKQAVSNYTDDFIHMAANNRGGLVGAFDTELYVGGDEYSFLYPCSQIFNNLYVTADGYLDACCQDFDRKMIIADLNSISALDAWNGKTFTDFRKRYLTKELKGTLCMSCLGWDTSEKTMPLDDKYQGYGRDLRKEINLRERVSRLVHYVDANE